MRFPRCDLESVAIWPDVRWSRVLGWANHFSTFIPSSGRVAFQLSNSPYFLGALIACWKRGVVPALIHPKFPSTWIEDLEEVVRWDQFVDGDLFASWCESLTEEDAREHLEIDSSTYASILFTSGSRGLPKPMLHTFDAHIKSAEGANAKMPFYLGHRWLVSLPLCHVGGLSLLFRSSLSGGALLFPDSQERPTHVSWVPTQLQRALDSGDTEWLTYLELLLIGGGPVSDSLFQRCVELSIPIRQTYGMTETASQVATGEPLKNDCGLPLEHRKLRIENGEIVVGGETLASGFITPDGIVPVTENGELRTGDLGRIDADGNLAVTGRADNMFISGGENIQPETIESICIDFGFSEAVVVPVSDDQFGQRPFLFLDRLPTPEDQTLLEARLAKFMRPVGYGVLPEKEGLKRSRARLKLLAELRHR